MVEPKHQAGWVSNMDVSTRYIQNMMEFLKTIGTCPYVGFLDYENAFDFISRANIIMHLKLLQQFAWD